MLMSLLQVIKIY